MVLFLRTPETIRIGVLGNFSGRASQLSVSGRNAIEMAVDEYNESQKKYKIELVMKDDRGIESEAIKKVEELISENINIIVGPFTSNIGVAIKEFYSKDNIIFLSPTVSTSTLSDIDDNLIRIISNNYFQGEELGRFVVENTNIKNIGIIIEYSNRNYTEEVRAGFIKEYKKTGRKLGYNEIFVSSSNAPLSNIADDLLSSNVDGVLILAGGIDTAQICQHIRVRNKDIQIISGLWAKTDDFIINGGASVENVILAGLNEEETEKYIDFKNKYIEVYKTKPTFSSVFSYDLLQILFLAINSIDKITPEKLKMEIVKKEYQGLHENIYINGYGDSERNYFFFIVRNGEYIYFE